MEMDPNPPQFNLTYDVKPMDIGSGYAQGITAAGESLSKSISGVFDIAQRNDAANQVLSTLNKNKILPDDQYQSVMGKSLAAREAMVGMYSGGWIQQQQLQKELALEQGKQQLLLNLAKQYPQLAGIDPKKLILQPGGQQTQTDQSNQPAVLTGPGGPLTPPSVSPQQAQQIQQIGQGPLGIGAGVSRPQLGTAGPILGVPVKRGTRLQPGQTVTQFQKGNQVVQFVKSPDGTVQEITD